MTAELGLPAPHKFHVGEIVNFRPLSRNVPGRAYEMIKQLLHNGREFEYCIKSANEEHQPVAGESELTKLWRAGRSTPISPWDRPKNNN